MIINKKIVSIGGGTGSFTILSGLKKLDQFQLSAIVSMADDGGSTGRLRDDLGVLPPGDVRQCLVALSNESQAVRELFNYRFEEGDLKGHTVGNILLSAMEKKTGSFSRGLEIAMKVLNIKGRVIPVTIDNVTLWVELKNDKFLKGEAEINKSDSLLSEGIRRIFLEPRAKINKEAKNVIKQADAIIIGPGNHYCSIVPNLLVDGMSTALQKSKAKLIYISNLVNKKGHTTNFTLDDYTDSINELIGSERIDYVVFNTQKPSPELEEKYKKRGEEMLTYQKKANKKRSFKVVEEKLLGEEVKQGKSDKLSTGRCLIRHDSDKLAKIVEKIV